MHYEHTQTLSTSACEAKPQREGVEARVVSTTSREGRQLRNRDRVYPPGLILWTAPNKRRFLSRMRRAFRAQRRLARSSKGVSPGIRISFVAERWKAGRRRWQFNVEAA